MSSALTHEEVVSLTCTLQLRIAIIIRFLAYEDMKPVEILQRLSVQLGDQSLSRAREFACHNKFKEGHNRLKMKNMMAVPGPVLRRRIFARYVTSFSFRNYSTGWSKLREVSNNHHKGSRVS